MEIFAYGEDALTLWALKNKLSLILQLLHDSSTSAECQAFFRPSFGRSGGPASPQFGEFDFIILSKYCIYLGESKWDRSSEKVQEGILALRPEQQLRHDLFKFYIMEWAFGQYKDWAAFESEAKPKLQAQGIEKPIVPTGKLLASNLRTVRRISSCTYIQIQGKANCLNVQEKISMLLRLIIQNMLLITLSKLMYDGLSHPTQRALDAGESPRFQAVSSPQLFSHRTACRRPPQRK